MEISNTFALVEQAINFYLNKNINYRSSYSKGTTSNTSFS